MRIYCDVCRKVAVSPSTIELLETCQCGQPTNQRGTIMEKQLTCDDVGCQCDKPVQYIEWTNHGNSWRAAWVPKSYDTSSYELKCEFLSKDMLGNNIWKPCEDPHVSVLVLALINSDRETIKIHRENSVDHSGMLLQPEDKCPESPMVGDCYYNPSNDVFKRWDGEQWVIYASSRWFYTTQTISPIFPIGE